MIKLIAALCISVAACHSGRTIVSAEEPVSTMLKEGNQEACAHPAVEKRILADINSGMNDPTPESVASFGVSGVTQEDVDEAVKSFPEPTLEGAQALSSGKATNTLSCAAHIEFGGSAPAMTTEYDLQASSVAADDFLVSYPKTLLSAKGLRLTYVGMKAAHIAAIRKQAT